MIYVYVYPVTGFSRNIADDRLKNAFLKKEGVERYTLERFIEALNDDFINTDTHWIRKVEDREGCYPVSSMHISDLEESGFDVSKVSESDLLTLADKLNDDYRDLTYWISLSNIAENHGIPKRNKTIISLRT